MNKTGIEPVQFSVLIEVDEIEDKSAGGIFLPQHSIDREQMGHDRGKLIAKSDMAFEDWSGTTPQVGDKVIFKKYAGTVIQQRGQDRSVVGKYRLCNDKDICAIIREE